MVFINIRIFNVSLQNAPSSNRKWYHLQFNTITGVFTLFFYEWIIFYFTIPTHLHDKNIHKL